jgi:single-strand DNA-binding protein
MGEIRSSQSSQQKGIAMADAEISLVGNIVREPVLEKSQNKTIFTRNSIAIDSQRPDGNGGWTRGETTYMDISAFGDLAEHLVASVDKGTRVMVAGRLQQRTVENDAGEKRSFYSLVCTEIGVSLRWVTVDGITKRSGRGATKLKIKAQRSGARSQATTSTKKSKSSKKSKRTTKDAIEAPF